MDTFRRVVREIHRRSLWQVLTIYAVASWAVISGVGTLGDALGLPDWFPRLALGMLIVGLPIVLATAFVREGTSASQDPGGVTDTGTVGGGGLLTWRRVLFGGVVAFALWGAVAAGWVLMGPDAGSDAGAAAEDVDQSVAVLPFLNMSGNEDNEYFSDGITEEILNALAQLPGLRVPGRTSSFAFKGQVLTIRQIADTLDVAHVLEGSVRRDGDRVRITAQLVDATSDTHLWSDTYERELEDIFSIQREIAAAIADQLRITLSGGIEAAGIAEGTESREAYLALLRGRFYLAERTVESLQSAIAEFGRATELDPSYAEAWSGLADAHVVMIPVAISQGGALEPDDVRRHNELSLSAARRAVALAPELGPAQASLGRALTDFGEWEAAEEALARAIALTPGYAPAYHWYALLLTYVGRADEGVGHAQRAVSLDPVSLVASWTLAWALQIAGRLEEAGAQHRSTIALDPNWSQTHLYYAMVLWQLGAYEEGRAQFGTWVDLIGMPPEIRPVMMEVADAAARFNRTGEPQELPARLRTYSADSWILGFLVGDIEYMLEGMSMFPATEAEFVTQDAIMTAFLGRDHPIFEDPRYLALWEEAGVAR